ncbi:tyrosine-type recombinase/integrase [Isosphaeraceae bacterium EP7]
MLGVTGFNAREDVRHARRSLTDEELGRLIRAAERGPVVYGLCGTDRAMAYRLAVGTGYRVNELRALTLENFHLDGSHPRVVLRPAETKNRRGADQPLPAPLAEELRGWLASKPRGDPSCRCITRRPR